jgi:hypothetical protein
MLMKLEVSWLRGILGTADILLDKKPGGIKIVTTHIASLSMWVVTLLFPIAKELRGPQRSCQASHVQAMSGGEGISVACWSLISPNP